MLLKQIYFCRMYLLKQFHLQYSCMCLQDIHETLCISVRIITFRICTITISVSISTNIIFYPKINWIFNFWFQLRNDINYLNIFSYFYWICLGYHYISQTKVILDIEQMTLSTSSTLTLFFTTFIWVSSFMSILFNRLLSKLCWLFWLMRKFGILSKYISKSWYNKLFNFKYCKKSKMPPVLVLVFRLVKTSIEKESP